MPLTTSTFLESSISVSMVLLMISLVLAFWRLVKGPSLPDRIVAFDLIVVIILGMIILSSVMTGVPLYLDAAVILALVSFLGTVAYAQYMEKRVLT
jgi:multicomponent Na+:H+ antiporter subunit F